MKTILLISGLCVVACLLWACSPRNADPGQTVNAQHALQREDVIVLDVRTGVEFATGHLDDAINIPVSELDERVGELPEDPSTPIMVYCRSGGRSARAKAILETHGYTDVTDGGAFKSLRETGR